MQLYLSKLFVFALLTILRLISGLCPLVISRKIKRKYGMDNVKTWIDKSVSGCMDFSGGILLATCFIHMIPEVREELMKGLDDKYQFPYAETLVCIGFFTVFVIEESVKHVLLSKPSHKVVKKSGALISSKLNEMSGIEITGKNHDDRDKEIGAGNADMSGDSNGNGLPVSVTANNGLMLEMNSMIREDMNECNNNTKGNSARNLRNFLLITALSFHSVMEGLAIGLAIDVADVWYLFLAVTVHECTILLCIGMEMVASCPSASTVIMYIVVFALVSPAGVLLGTLITSFLSETGSLPFQSTIIGSLQGLAAGTILYVTFFEVLNNHKHHHHHGRTHQSKSGLPKLIFIASGFIFMVVLELIGGHSNRAHNHHHEHIANNNASY